MWSGSEGWLFGTFSPTRYRLDGASPMVGRFLPDLGFRQLPSRFPAHNLPESASALARQQGAVAIPRTSCDRQPRPAATFVAERRTLYMQRLALAPVVSASRRV